MAGLAVAGLLALMFLSGCGDDEPASAVQSFEGRDGAALYGQACAECHGVALEGTDQGPPFLDQIYAPGHHADAAFFLAAKTGTRAHHWNFGDMPPVEGLSDEQLEAIVAFVRTEQAAAGIE